VAYAGWGEWVADDYFRDAIIKELGWGFLIQAVIASVLPTVAILASGVYDFAPWRAKCRSNSGRPNEG
jgi:hypothetical protein